MQEGPLLMAAILAHQGGWDEILLVATPIVAIIVILRVVKQRVEAADTPAGTDMPASTDDVSDDVSPR